MSHLTPKERLIRYLAKVEIYKDDAVYMDNKHLSKCIVGGQLSEANVRQHFIDRNILTAEEFDTAVSELRASGDVHPSQFKATASTISKHEAKEIEMAALIEAKEVERQEKVKNLDK